MFHVPLRTARLPAFTPTFLRMTECPSFSSSNKSLLRDAIPLMLGLRCPIYLNDFAKWAVKLAISVFRSSSEILPIDPETLLLGKTVKCPNRNMLSFFNPLFSKSGSPFLMATSKPSTKFQICEVIPQTSKSPWRGNSLKTARGRSLILPSACGIAEMAMSPGIIF